MFRPRGSPVRDRDLKHMGGYRAIVAGRKLIHSIEEEIHAVLYGIYGERVVNLEMSRFDIGLIY